MKRVVSGLKKFAELYLIIVGGGYTLASSVGLVVNTKGFLRCTDEIEAKAFRQDVTEGLVMFVFAALLLAAGVGIHKSRLWGLVLAAGMGILTVGYSLVQNSSGLSDYHDFTIALPMGLIFIWAVLPHTWLEFTRQGIRAS
jgi:hypothetical protein